MKVFQQALFSRIWYETNPIWQYFVNLFVNHFIQDDDNHDNNSDEDNEISFLISYTFFFSREAWDYLSRTKIESLFRTPSLNTETYQQQGVFHSLNVLFLDNQRKN